MTRSTTQARRHPVGFTLLEVILALAVLAVSLAIVGEANNLADGNARRAALESEATLVAESLLAEYAAGTTELTAVESTPWLEADGESLWTYSTTPEPTQQEGLLAVRVRVWETQPARQPPVRVDLLRWIVDPLWLETQQATAESLGSGATP